VSLERPPPELAWLGPVPYGEALTRQRARRDAVLARQAPEAVWLLEHDPPVVTVGRRPAPGNPSPEALAARGIEHVATERGGLATWHGPGQLVGYLIVDAGGRGLGVRGMVAAIEQAVIDWLGGEGIEAERRAGWPGVWAGRDKICALGLHFRRGISMHGFALNLCPDLEAGFGVILPCGIVDGGVTSVERLTGRVLRPEVVWRGVCGELVEKLFDGERAAL
jgi:lipoyl(octanoyl) transferase